MFLDTILTGSLGVAIQFYNENLPPVVAKAYGPLIVNADVPARSKHQGIPSNSHSKWIGCDCDTCLTDLSRLKVYSPAGRLWITRIYYLFIDLIYCGRIFFITMSIIYFNWQSRQLRVRLLGTELPENLVFDGQLSTSSQVGHPMPQHHSIQCIVCI